MPKVKVLVVGAWEIFGEGLVRLLQSQSSIDAVSVSNTVSRAVKAARAHKPDVVITDIQSPKGSNVELIQHIHEAVPDAHIIVLSHSETMTDFFLAIKAGAIGYISKDNNCERIAKAIALAAEGEFIIDPPIAGKIIRALKYLDEHRHGAQVNLLNTLSERERAVLALMAHGTTNRGIASALFITTNTVKVHVHNIMYKLHACNRSEAIACAMEEGLQFSEAGIGMEQM